MVRQMCGGAGSVEAAVVRDHEIGPRGVGFGAGRRCGAQRRGGRSGAGRRRRWRRLDVKHAIFPFFLVHHRRVADHGTRRDVRVRRVLTGLVAVHELQRVRAAPRLDLVLRVRRSAPRVLRVSQHPFVRSLNRAPRAWSAGTFTAPRRNHFDIESNVSVCVPWAMPGWSTVIYTNWY